MKVDIKVDKPRSEVGIITNTNSIFIGNNYSIVVDIYLQSNINYCID